MHNHKKSFIKRLVATYREERMKIDAILLFTIVLTITAGLASLPPADFEYASVSIPQNSSLGEIAVILEENGVIKSPFLYKASVVLLRGQRSIQSGKYIFNRPETVVDVARRTIKGIKHQPRIVVTIPEGWTAQAIADAFSKKFPDLDRSRFLSRIKKYEGYLFPDTYVFYDDSSEDEMVRAMRSNFERRLASIDDQIEKFGRPLDEVIRMASIVEREAATPQDRRIVAGILWKRLDKGMPLQVDAPFYYTLGKASSEITRSDLAEDSPYNTYKNKGLPPTPISNPGLAAILDTVNAEDQPYWFYLSDKNGTIHYASTYDGHVNNISKYLRSSSSN